MNKIEIISHVKDGVLDRNRGRISEAVKHFEGKDVIVTIERKRNKRSDNQNRYYWGVVVPLVADGIKNTWGDPVSHETAHELLKSQFLFWEKVSEYSGEIMRLPKSTTECTTTELEEYMEQCRQFAFEWFGVTIPMPNEQLTIV